jgi:hypothetical protein
LTIQERTAEEPGGNTTSLERPRWTFQPACPQAFASSEPRVFLVGEEPNGDNWPRYEPRDMGYFFREGLRTRGFGNVKFLRASLLCLDGVLRPLTIPPWPEWWENLTLAALLLDHLLYLDLRAIEGGGRTKAAGESKRSRVLQYVKNNLNEIVDYWDRWKPSHTVLLGGIAREVFEKVVVRELRRRGIGVLRMGWPHPSANGYPEADVAKLQKNFRPLDRPILW